MNTTAHHPSTDGSIVSTIVPQRKREFSYHPPCEPLKIYHQDSMILVAEKPAELLSVPGKSSHHKDSMQTRLLAQFPELGVVHRLDMATSGLMVFALSKAAQRHLGLQFERRHVKKRYVAQIWGTPHAPKGEIDLPLRCDWPNRPLQTVDFKQGRAAQTRFEIANHSGDHTTLFLYPVTGRSHQLRVHLQAIGHPILGDGFYAHDAAYKATPRLMLHADQLSFFHPEDGRQCLFRSPPPF